jgi:hypothetical protein
MRSHTGEKPFKCRFDGCDKEYYDKGNLKYHEKTCHIYEVKALPYTCEHMGCNMKFKTRKQKAVHHHNLEPECKNEKTAMMKLLSQYKKVLNNIICDYSLPLSEIQKREDYCKLRFIYEELEKKLIDPDLFYVSLGDSFEEKIEK